MFWKPNKISVKINLVVFLIISLFMFINGIYSYYEYKNKEMKRIKSDLDTLLQRLSKNTADLLWNYNYNSLKEIINMEMNYNYITGIVIRENEKFLLSMFKDKNQDYKTVEISDNNKISEFLKNNPQKKDIPIIYDNRKIAQLIVVFTNRFINRELYFMMIKIIIQTLLLTLAITTLLSLSTNKIIAKPIKNIVNVANNIANGDMTVNEVKTKSKDEIGTLARSFGKMTSSLNNTLGQVNSVVEQVTFGSSQVAQASQSLSQGATEQACSLQEITSSIIEISSRAKQNADNALQANDLSKNAMENANRGNKQIKELITAMNDINKSSDNIKKIVKVIDDIAFQTNLLALNANVEAARAGKYGKGFTIVAEEVRNLATISAERVQETNQMVEESIKNIETGNKIVKMTAEQFEDIMTGTNKAAILVEEIAVTSKEQTVGLEHIYDGLGQIDQVTQKNTVNAEESASVAKELAGRAQQLKSVIANFKLAKNNIITESEKIDLTREEIKNIYNSTGYI